MKKILIVCYNNLKADPRVLRQIEALKSEFHISTLAIDDCGLENIPNFSIYKIPSTNYFRKLKRLFHFLFQKFDKYYWDDYRIEILNHFKDNKIDLIIANDIQTLPLALKIANNKTPVLFDSHDFHPNEFDENLVWRIKDKKYINYLCKTYIPKATKFITSSESISKEYYKYINILPEVIDNAREYYDIEPSKVEDTIKLVHHGAAISGRRLENMIEVVKALGGGYQLYFMLTNKNSKYYNFLIKESIKLNNVFFIDAVPYNKIIVTLNKFDIGIYHLDESNINNSILLPNKIYEFVQARLCCVVSPTKELKKIVNENNLGIVSSDFDPLNMANEIKKLSNQDIMNYKIKCHNIAKTLSSENNLLKLNSMVKSLIN